MLNFDTALDIKSQLLQGVNKMRLKSKLKQVFVITGISVAALVTTPATAAPMVSLDITGGCFSFGGGAAGATGCGNTDSSHKEYATGSFVFTNTLSAAFDPLTDDGAFSAFANLSATNGTTNFNDTRSKTFPSFSALTTDPLWGLASGLVFAIGANPVTGSLPGSFGIDLSWENVLNPASTATNAFGTFKFFSDDNLNGLSQALFGQPLPLSEVSFNAQARLALIPEPMTLTLLGLGLFSMVALRRRMPG